MKLRFWGLMAVATALLVSSTLAAAASPQASSSKQDRFCVGNCLVLHESGSLVTAVVVDKRGQIVSTATVSVPRNGIQPTHIVTSYMDLTSGKVEGTVDKNSGCRIQTTAPTETIPTPGGGWVIIIHQAGYDVVLVYDASGKLLSSNIVPHGLVK